MLWANQLLALEEPSYIFYKHCNYFFFHQPFYIPLYLHNLHFSTSVSNYLKKHLQIAYEVLLILTFSFYCYHYLQILKHVQYIKITYLYIIFLVHNVRLMLHRYQYLHWTFLASLLLNLKLFALSLMLIYLAAKEFSHQLFLFE